MLHHPWVLGGVAWWALLSVVVRLDAGALIVGLMPTLAIVVNYWLVRKRTGRLGAQVAEVHVLVNAQRTVLENRIAQLEETIVSSNKEIPSTTRETKAAP